MVWNRFPHYMPSVDTPNKQPVMRIFDVFIISKISGSFPAYSEPGLTKNSWNLRERRGGISGYQEHPQPLHPFKFWSNNLVSVIWGDVALTWRYYNGHTAGLYRKQIFSVANLALAGFPLTNALGESMPSRL